MNKLITTIALAALLTSCGSTPRDPSETPPSATRTPRITDDSGRPDITFDPCHDIPDDIMNAAGYNAAKKRLADMPMGDYTFLGCEYDNKSRSLEVGHFMIFTVLSGNVALEEEIAKNGHISDGTSVNGRSALVRVDPDSKRDCTYVLQTSFGIIIFRRGYVSHSSEPPWSNDCDGMLDLLTKIEPSIGN